MRRRRSNLALYLVGTAVAVASWTVAGTAMADTIILNPAEMTGQVSFGAETLSQFKVEAHSTDGLKSSGTFTTSPYLLTVESGHSYNPWIYGYFSNPTASYSYLRIIRNDAVLIDNTQGQTTVDFNYPNINHVNFSINVTGGTIRDYSMVAYANADTESYYASTHNSFPSPYPSSTTSWHAMVPNSAVTVYGTAYLTAADGTDVTRDITPQVVDLSQGSVSVNFPIDLTATGTLAGDVELTTGAAISSHTVEFRGVSGTPTYGVSGSKSVSANGSYSVDLAPGDYDVYLRTNFTSPDRYSDTKSYRVTITAGSTIAQDFIENLGNGQVPLTVSGFFSNDDLSWVHMYLRRQDPSPGLQTFAYHSKPTSGPLDFPLQSGDWKRLFLNLNLYDVSDPNLPLNTQYYRFHSDSDVVPVTVSPGMTADLGSEDVTLVKSNAYFDVTEPEEQTEPILISSPYVEVHRYDYNGDNTLKTYIHIWAWGSSEAKAQSALTIAAEPGTYEMGAYATVNGSVVQFKSSPITFGAPVNTPVGMPVEVKPTQNDNLVVTVSFPQVTVEGFTTGVETPLGPQPPPGFSVTCPYDPNDPPPFECDAMYYDIHTTADYPKDANGNADPPIMVCVQQRFSQDNWLEQFLSLGHYNEVTGTWEELPTPTPPPPAMQYPINCLDYPDLCDCADETCGIDFTSETPGSVFKLCGLTTSFSPFAILKGPIKFTNEVNGQDYEGPTGPPSLQTWTVPENGTYRITAHGASGAAAIAAQSQGRSGGCGAEITGDFVLQAGDTLQMLVAQKGTAAQYSGGGGGGTFVTLNGTPLVIAGGGGGVRSGALVDGRHGSIGADGVSGSVSSSYTSGFIPGGTGGLGGARGSGYGSAGGGWLGNGASDGSYGEGGFAFLNGGKGGFGKLCGTPAHGGYGGGGAGNGCYGGGGGGGYSGGGSGRVAGGGGSWNAGANPRGVEGVCTPSGHGIVTIQHLQ